MFKRRKDSVKELIKTVNNSQEFKEWNKEDKYVIKGVINLNKRNLDFLAVNKLDDSDYTKYVIYVKDLL